MKKIIFSFFVTVLLSLCVVLPFLLNTLIERSIENVLPDLFSPYTAKISPIEFSLLKRKIHLENISVSANYHTQTESYHIKKADIILSTDLLFNFLKAASGFDLPKQIEFADSVYAEYLTATVEKDSAFFASCFIGRLYMSSDDFKSLVKDRQLPEFTEKRLSAEDITITSPHIYIPNKNISVKADQCTLNRVDREKINEISVKNLTVRYNEDDFFAAKGLVCGHLKTLPQQFFEQFQVYCQAASAEEFSSLVATLLHEKEPLFRTLYLKEATLNSGSIPLSLKESSIIWRATLPFDISVVAEKASIPSKALEQQFSMRLPLLENVVFDLKCDVMELGPSTFREKLSLESQDLANFQCDISQTFSETLSISSSYINAALGLTINGLDIKFSDKGLTAYTVLNLQNEFEDGMQAYLQNLVPMLIPFFSSEEATGFTRNMLLFLQNPGEFSLKLQHPPLTWFNVITNISNLKNLFQTTVILGNAPLSKQIEKLNSVQ